MATRKPRAAKPEPSTEPVALVLPDEVAGVHAKITLAGIRRYAIKSDENNVRAAIGLAFVDARGALPSVRETEKATGIGKSTVSRSLILGRLLIALTPTISEALDVRYVYQGTRYAGSLEGVEAAFGQPLDQAPRAQVLEWFALEADRLRNLSDDEAKAERMPASREAKPDDGTKAGKVTASMTFAKVVETVHAAMEHITSADYEVPVPEDLDPETAAQIAGIVKAAHALARATGVEAVKPVRQRRAAGAPTPEEVAA